MGWLSEKDMDIRTEDFLKPEGHATRRAADTTRNVDEDRMYRVRMDASLFKLTDQALDADRVAEKQIRGVFIIDKVTARVVRCFAASLRDRDLIVAWVFDYRHAFAAQEVFFPLTRVRGHVHSDLKTEFRADDADRKTEVAGGTDRDRILREKVAEARFGEDCVIII